MNPIGSGVELDLVPVACAMCGSSDTKPRPVFEGYDYEYRTCDNRFRFVACADCGHVYLSPRVRMEDIGAGFGGNLTYLAELAPFPLQLFANDLKFEPEARSYLADRGVTLIEGPIEDVQCGVQFDAIICQHAIEHVTDPERLVRRIADHLAPGGIVYLETPDLNALSRYVFRNQWQALSTPRHFHVFSRKAFAACVRRCDLEISLSRYAA